LKAEVFVAEILQSSNVNIEEIDVFYKSIFSRSYRRDVIDFHLDNYSGGYDRLQINVARNGMYDLLPEGLFHEPIKEAKAESFKEIRKRHKEEEKDARSFFAPIENEFFTQKVRIEQNERALIDEFISLKNDFLIEFWGLSNKLPKEYSLKLLKLLPFVHKISGNPELTAISLEKILDVKVAIKRTFKPYPYPPSADKVKQLGVDFVLGVVESSEILYPVFEIKVGPIARKNMSKFLQNGVALKIISIFCDYFIPLEIETELEIAYSKKESQFVLNELDYPVLGLTTMI